VRPFAFSVAAEAGGLLPRPIFCAWMRRGGLTYSAVYWGGPAARIGEEIP
jgi:hypothetical protein